MKQLGFTRLGLATALAGASLFIGTGAAHAGSVEVTYTGADQYTDAGRGRDLEQVEWALTQHLQKLGATGLPADVTLKIEVTDIDLAGEVRPWRGLWRDVRVMRGTTDWPRIELGFSLERGGQVVDSGKERVADLAYLAVGSSVHLDSSEGLFFEKRMLSNWFAKRFSGKN